MERASCCHERRKRGLAALNPVADSYGLGQINRSEALLIGVQIILLRNPCFESSNQFQRARVERKAGRTDAIDQGLLLNPGWPVQWKLRWESG
jgi:hypothetical protein